MGRRGSRPMSGARRISVVATAALVAAGTFMSGAFLVASAVPASAGRVLLPSSLAKVPSGAVRLGPLAASRRLQLEVALKPSSTAAVMSYARAVGDPHSASYHRFLTPEQFAARFAPPLSVVRSMQRSLAATGLSVGAAAANRLSIPVAGTVAAVERAFHTSLSNFRLRSGRTAFGPTETPSIPVVGGASVQGILGLDDLALPVQSAVRTSALPATAAAHPAVAAAPTPLCSGMSVGYTADQVAAAYGLDPLYSQGDFGAGATIGVIEAGTYGRLATDLAHYEVCYGIAPTVNYYASTSSDGGSPNPILASQDDEVALDIEQVMGLAPQATIDVYTETPDSVSNLYCAYLAAITGSGTTPTGTSGSWTPGCGAAGAPTGSARPSVITTSWGQCEANTAPALLSAEQVLFAEAQTQNQTVFAASGDNGADDCGGATLGVDDPADQDNVVGVGGTSLTYPAASWTESAWNQTSPAKAGGGGFDSYVPSASFGGQVPANQPTVLQNPANCSTACREVPDVSANAAPVGYAMYYNGWIGLGGTSASAPLWAAVMALTTTSSYCSYYDPSPNSVGGLSGSLYGLLGTADVNGSSLWSDSFNDITTGSNGGYLATVGYDTATGLGSPVAARSNAVPGFAASVCMLAALQGSRAPIPNLASVSPTSGSDAQGTTVTVRGSNFLAIAGADEVRIAGAGITTAYLPASNVTCTTPISAPSACSATVVIPELDEQTSNATLQMVVERALIPSTTVVFSPTAGAPAMGAAATPSSISYGSATVLTVSSLPSDASGTVTFSANGSTLCSYLIGAANGCTSPISLGAGNYGVTASYAPAAGAPFLAATATTSFTVSSNPAPSFAAVASPANAAHGQAVTLFAGGLASSATGTVTMTSGSTTLCSYQVTSASSCSTASTLAAGSYPVTASYSGDGNFTSASATTGFTLTAVTTHLVSESIPGTSATGKAITLVAAGLASDATGTVTFSARGKTLCSFTVGFVTRCVTRKTLAAGTYAVAARYSGDENYTAASSSTRFVLKKAPKTPKNEKCTPQRRTVSLRQTVLKGGKPVSVVTKRVVTVQVCTFVRKKAPKTPKNEKCTPQKRTVPFRQTVLKGGKPVPVVTKRVVTVQVCTKK